jgi:hypothetical protein
MDPHVVLDLCHEHAAAEAVFDVDRILATFAPVPRYEFYPLAKSVTGWANAERFYRDQFPRFVSQIGDFELLGEWANEHAAIQEYLMTLRSSEDRSVSYRVMSMMPVDEESGLLAGEQVYSDDGFVRTLLGDLYELLEPIATS